MQTAQRWVVCTSAGTVLVKVLLVQAEMVNQGYIKRDMTGELQISGENFVNSLGIEEEGSMQRNLQLSVVLENADNADGADPRLSVHCHREVWRRNI